MTEEAKNGADLYETERLKIYATRLKVQVLQGAIDAFRQRQNALAIEMDVLPKKMAEAESQQSELLKEFEAAYAGLKEKLGLEEGQEVNLETGEIVSPD